MEAEHAQRASRSSAIVGCVSIVSRKPVEGRPASIAVCTTGHHLTGLRAEYRAAEKAFVLRVDGRLHHGARLGNRPCLQYGVHRERRDAHGHAEASGVAFVQADPCEGPVREQAEGDEPVARGAILGFPSLRVAQGDRT
jgi:hypothetical protein